MFTGLVQALGTLQSLSTDRLQITCLAQTAHRILSDLAIGDSISVDGACLTVVEILSQGFSAAVSPETLQRTTLGSSISNNRIVNLETSLRVGSKLGGHFVTGHVDGIGCLQKSVQTANAWEMHFTAPDRLKPLWMQHIAPYIVSKGSITINGVSLTVADCDSTGLEFKVAVIPHTFQETNLSRLKPGSWVNLEGDILSKYVEKLLRSGRLNLSSAPNQKGDSERSETSDLTALWGDAITPDFLTEHGYY